ncbi:MAG: DUF4071 domain-containing protein [Deltaproteobacteria bacterium]|nr:DUF4071 domain-containing protein [Deltaproteobacteria bacterium]
MTRPLCFVLMPFGRKPGPGGTVIDFDAVYSKLIAPAIEDAELDPLRADDEQVGGIIHKPMFERLILCEYAVADLTSANANVFYELGLRHAVKKASTVLLFAAGNTLPFDVVQLRAIPYKLGADGLPADVAADRAALTKRLKAAREMATDSPVFELVDGFPDIQRLKTDVFRDRVDYSRRMKDRLLAARKQGADAVRAVAKDIGNIGDAEAGVGVDLFLSYRAVKAWTDMIDLVAQMSRPLAATTMIQEQLGLALNRAGRGDEAERVLCELIESRGPSSETCGILGRVYKDRWEAALAAGDTFAARGLLDKAIATYQQGFETDWRDAYPGVNAVTLMELKQTPDPKRLQLIPIVTYAVERRIAAGKPDYWDYATLLELKVLGKDEQGAYDALSAALALIRETWEPETTARNLRLIREARKARGEEIAWAAAIEAELDKKARG